MPPLAERIRPQTIAHLSGQDHLAPLIKLTESGYLPSLLLWGPPGTGKTTLAYLLAKAVNRPIRVLNAIQAGVKDIREVIEYAQSYRGTVLFIDEIHRFNKAQQDALLNAVEKGLVTLIGATTENPSFEVIPALLSRCQVYILKPLSPEAITAILRRAVETDFELKRRKIELLQTQACYRISGGDARKALNLLELIVQEFPDAEPLIITDEMVQTVAQNRIALYDKNGEQHYDLISAFIKSVRGSDPNGALYWLARMLEGGEQPRFIARRLVILASEDIGNANPNALLLATTAFQAVEMIGMPEARIVLAQVTTYLATSLKSNASYVGISEAMQAVRQGNDPPVPLHLRNAPTELMNDLGYGADYKYSHDYQGGQGAQEYLPTGLEGTAFYRPKPVGKEKEIVAYLKYYWGDKYGYDGNT
jgi:putative ATPase